MQMLIFIIRNKTWKFIKKKKKFILLLYIVTYLKTKKLAKMAKYSFCPKVLAKCPYFEIRFSKNQISLRNSSFQKIFKESTSSIIFFFFFKFDILPITRFSINRVLKHRHIARQFQNKDILLKLLSEKGILPFLPQKIIMPIRILIIIKFRQNEICLYRSYLENISYVFYTFQCFHY